MAFNDSPRVVYQRNPLIEVICQVRFRAILRIDTEPPADFQERIRNLYPLYREDPGAPLVPDLPEDVRQLVGGLLGSTPLAEKRVNRIFQSEDEVWTVTLARESLALSTKRYESWTEFRDRMNKVLDAFAAVYNPMVFTRIGLRYQNLIRRSTLGLSTLEWKDLLEPHIAGPLATDAIAGREIDEAGGVLALSGSGAIRVTLRHGIVIAESTEGQESSYLIDSDFYTEERTNADAIFDFLDAANADAGGLFRWCITSRVHEALQPVET